LNKFLPILSREEMKKKIHDKIEFWKVEHRSDGRDHNVGVNMKEIEQDELVKSICTDGWSWTFWYGITSNYPLCCVIFFTDVWHDIQGEEIVLTRNEKRKWDFDMGYILCPNCAIDCFCIRNPKLEREWKKLNDRLDKDRE